ncbi:unnamed protein product [Prorocentrum cordatum]|uniref:Protein kinase domain-containing protein n=1 Tax=Prorocentrum cordatum TaxID=2364126 RepID=A0ABN9XTT2_9DINO|nr:unnamed protein product [Polarella glacialis]
MMSPEMVLGDLYDFGTDVWSFGAMAYLILFGELPYVPKEMSRCAAKDRGNAIRAGQPSPRFLGAPGPAAGFLRPLLEREPLFRCSAEEALAHPSLGRDQPTVVSSVLRGVPNLQRSMELFRSATGGTASLATAETDAFGATDSMTTRSAHTSRRGSRRSVMIDDHDLGAHEDGTKNDPSTVE